MYHSLWNSKTHRQAGRRADRKSENNASDCVRIEWEAGDYLGKKVRAQKDRRRSGANDLREAGEPEDRQADR